MLHLDVRSFATYLRDQSHTYLAYRCVNDAETKREPLVSPVRNINSQAIKEDLGRSTWTLLHTMAAQYPDKPSKRQRKDVEILV